MTPTQVFFINPLTITTSSLRSHIIPFCCGSLRHYFHNHTHTLTQNRVQMWNSRLHFQLSMVHIVLPQKNDQIGEYEIKQSIFKIQYIWNSDYVAGYTFFFFPYLRHTSFLGQGSNPNHNTGSLTQQATIELQDTLILHIIPSIPKVFLLLLCLTAGTYSIEEKNLQNAVFLITVLIIQEKEHPITCHLIKGFPNLAL